MKNSSFKFRTFLIAEMACSHEGEMQLAKEIIDAAAEAKADAIQFQIWSVEHMMAPQRKEFSLLKKIEFSKKEWIHLRDYTRLNFPEMKLYVCVYEHNSIDFIDSLGVDGYKLNSSDLSNPLVLSKIAKTGKPINLSVGASTLGEIQAAVEQIQKISNSKITLMYGHQSFPTEPRNVNLSYLPKIKNLFDLPVGYQDHCAGDKDSAFWLPAVSMGMGVEVLEKHITHDRSQKGIDHESALNPDEFIQFVQMVRLIDIAKGCSTPKAFSEDEKKYRCFQKKSIVTVQDLKKGHILEEGNLTFMRAEKLGLSPDQIGEILGKKLKLNIGAYEILNQGDLQ